MNIENITQETFAAYERVRQSGVCNMLSKEVQMFANLTEAEHAAIIEHYEALCVKWPDIRNLARKE